MLQERLHHVNRQGEDDGGVFLSGDGVEGLQVAQLQRRRRLGDHHRGFLQCSRRVHLSLSGDHLREKERCSEPDDRKGARDSERRQKGNKRETTKGVRQRRSERDDRKGARDGGRGRRSER